MHLGDEELLVALEKYHLYLLNYVTESFLQMSIDPHRMLCGSKKALIFSEKRQLNKRTLRFF